MPFSFSFGTRPSSYHHPKVWFPRSCRQVMGTTLAVCIICSQRTTGELHLFKPPTFTFILHESISGKKLSPWWVLHGFNTNAPAMRRLQSSGTNNRLTLPVPGSQRAAGARFEHCNFLQAYTSAEAGRGGGSPAAASRQKAKQCSNHCTKFNTWRRRRDYRSCQHQTFRAADPP